MKWMTDKELDALLEAIGFRLSGDYDPEDVDVDLLESARRKLWDEVDRRAAARRKDS